MIFWDPFAPWNPDLLIEITEQPREVVIMVTWDFSAAHVEISPEN